MIKKRFITTFLILFVLSITGISFEAPCFATSYKSQTKAKIKHLKWLENLETNKLYKNQQKLERTSSNLDSSKKSLENAKSRLGKLETNLSVAISEFSRIDYKLRRKIRSIYKNQRRQFFELLLEAKDINTLLDRIYFESLLVKKDYQKMVYARRKAKEIATLKYNIEKQKRYLARTVKNINYQKSSIKREIAKNQRMIHKLRTDRKTYERAEKELARQSVSIQSMISRNSYSSNINIVSGFIKPIRGRISSPFGWRRHPIFKTRSFHSGIDIAGPNRGKVIASNSGKVIYCGWYGGYGKVVILDHGKLNGHPVTTLYAHLNSTDVCTGEYIVKGQVIGKEGTTGYSTGPHVHFEVRVNGKPNNPLNYI